MFRNIYATAAALLTILVLGCPRSASCAVIADVTVDGAYRYTVLTYPWSDWQVPQRIDVWYVPGSTITISGLLRDPGVHSGIAPLTLLDNFRADLAPYDSTILATQNLIQTPPHLALPPWGRGYTIYAGDFLSITTAPRATSVPYSTYLDIQYDVYTRTFDLELYWQTGAFAYGPWEYGGTSHNTVPLYLHAIPDAATVFLFGAGLAALSPLWLKKRNR